MTDKSKVKVIKKSEVKAAETVQPVKKESKKTAAREMVTTVASWVSEFKHRKHVETKTAIENFLVRQPEPTRP